MDVVTNEGVTALARSLENVADWKGRMPATAPGLRPGGDWRRWYLRKSNTFRLSYREPGVEHWIDIGEWVRQDAAPAPAVNGTGPKKGGRPAPPPAAPERAAQEPVASEEADPLILLTPAGGGAWRLSGYGVARAELIRALRLSLVHLVAREAGALIIDEVVAPEMAVVAEGLPRLPQPRNDKTAGKRKAAGGRVKRTVSYPDDDVIDDDDGDDAW